LHPNVEPLEFLVGTGSGRSYGVYPRIESFEEDETLSPAQNR
jgi:hypothetical protein